MSQGVRPEAAVSQGVRPEAAASQGGHGTTLCRTVVPTPPGQLIRASEITRTVTPVTTIVELLLVETV